MRRWTAAVFFLLIVVPSLAAAQKDPSEYPYEWRVADGRQSVLWLGGGHWHETLETAARLRRMLESGSRFHASKSRATTPRLTDAPAPSR